MPSPFAGTIKAARTSAAFTNPFASLRGRLILVTVVLAATASVMVVALLEDAAQRQQTAVKQELGETARALSLAADGQILERRAILRTMAASSALGSGDLKRFESEARTTLPGPSTWIVLFDTNGKVLMDTVKPNQAMADTVVRAGFARAWPALLKSRESISGLETGGGAFVLQLDNLITIHGKPTYDLVMAVLPPGLQSTFRRQSLPAKWHLGLVDRNAIVIAQNAQFQRVVGQRVSADLIKRLETTSSGVYEHISRAGVLSFSAYSRSPISGWTVILTVPRYEATSDFGRSLQSLSLVGAVLLLLGGVLTLWFMRSVARAVHGLENYADSVGRGEAGPPPPTGLRETDFIGSALGAAAERLWARELELERINQNLEARVKEASAQLVQSQKIEVIGRLTGGVAHDFNNLLTAVIGNLDMLRRKVIDERQLQFVQNARSAAERGAKLTAQLLAFARKQALTREPVDVNALICGMGELLASSLDREARIELDLDPDTPLAMADRTQLEMVLLNLVINARDALPPRGIVEISTGGESIDRPPEQPEHPPMGDFVRITVADNGAGMAREVLERVFEPFFTTKPPGRGSGLGLPQALGVVQQLGGGLSIESDLGQGARVHVYLPVAELPAPAASASRPKARGRAFAR